MDKISYEELERRFNNVRESLRQYMEQENQGAISKLSQALAMDDVVMKVYPCTILPARYGGTYEGSQWLAFNCYPEEIPDDAFGDDIDCMTWHDEHKDEIGHGNSPNQALNDLAKKLKK